MRRKDFQRKEGQEALEIKNVFDLRKPVGRSGSLQAPARMSSSV